jgi:phage terminase large subunit
MQKLVIPTPRWALPLLKPARYKGAKGGRGSGKSNFFAELVIDRMVENPDLSVVCLREVQKSLKFSAKKLIEKKIEKLGVSHLFDVYLTEIRRIGGSGVCIFEGMADHTADSIKSLEGFGVAWYEEAQRMSQRSLDLLRPTIREQGSEIWFSWNPENESDPIEQFMVHNDPGEHILVHVNYYDNPFLPDTLKDEAEYAKRVDPDNYQHIWLGGYNIKNNAQVFLDKWVIEEFDPIETWDGPYFGADWGFAQDPTTLVNCYIKDNCLYIYDEAYKVGCDIVDTPALFDSIEGSRRHKIRADSARPETISHVRNQGFNIDSVEKWSGSVEDGISFIRSFEKIVIHPQCQHTIEEFRLYSYKVDRLTGDILPTIIDKHNHIVDAVRYALAPIIKKSGGGFYVL